MPKHLPMQTMDLGSPTVQQNRRGIFGLLQSENGKRWLMFGTVSGVAVATAWVTTIVARTVFDQSLLRSQVWSVIISTIPAFLLSRYWVWAKDGRVSMRREVLPFWMLSIIQFFISTGVVSLADGWIHSSFASESTQTAVLLILSLGIYGLMWFAKFFFLNNLLFKAQPIESA
jgi:putative flippase GtrA